MLKINRLLFKDFQGWCGNPTFLFIISPLGVVGGSRGRRRGRLTRWRSRLWRRRLLTTVAMTTTTGSVLIGGSWTEGCLRCSVIDFLENILLVQCVLLTQVWSWKRWGFHQKLHIFKLGYLFIYLFCSYFSKSNCFHTVPKHFLMYIFSITSLMITQGSEHCHKWDLNSPRGQILGYFFTL